MPLCDICDQIAHNQRTGGATDWDYAAYAAERGCGQGAGCFARMRGMFAAELWTESRKAGREKANGGHAWRGQNPIHKSIANIFSLFSIS